MRHSLIRIAALAATIGVMAALPATAGAATTGGGQFGAVTLTVSVGNATLSQRVVVNVPVTLTCTLNPGAPADFPQFGTSLQVSIVQAIRKNSTMGSAFASGFACDGVPHTLAMQVIAEPASGGLHFAKGVAAVNVSASASGFDANTGIYGSDSVSTGWQTLRIK
jgi:hypothetical protein